MAIQAILVEWTESERGWGIRPDGYSVHLTKQAADDYFKEYWDSMPKAAPDEYSRPADKSLWETIVIADELYNILVASRTGSVRLWQHPNNEFPVTPTIVYRIRKRGTALYSTGGSIPSFSTKGKVWHQQSHLTNYLNQVIGSIAKVYKDCEIVAYEVTERETKVTPIPDYVQTRRNLRRVCKDQTITQEMIHGKAGNSRRVD